MLPYEVKFNLGGNTQYVALIRQVIASLAEELGEEHFPPDIARRCGIALVEAVNNAVHHAHNGNIMLPVGIRIKISKDEVRMEVKDQGKGFELQSVVLPSLNSVRGRGLYLIQSVMDEVSYLKGERQNTMVMICLKGSAKSRAGRNR